MFIYIYVYRYVMSHILFIIIEMKTTKWANKGVVKY